MNGLFLDTDIILDFLGNRKPFSKFAANIFLKAHQGKFKLYTSGNTVTTAYYILSKSVGENESRGLIADLLDYLHVIPVGEKMLRTALRSDFRDFEDAVQHQCALSVEQIQCIVTRNLKDYKSSQIKVVGPDAL